jgi:replication factor C subunit 2/4
MKFWEPVAHDAIPVGDLWYRKYEPTNLDDIIGNETIIRTLKYYLGNNNIPHLLIMGKNGVGKKTAITCLVKEYLGAHHEYACLNIHGSIYRGKDVVSENTDQKKSDKVYDAPNIINFIKKLTLLPKHLCKIIVIYDFDHMTKEAQMALRRIVEIYSDRTRFIFLCNDMSNIIEAIQSRCVLIKFNHISDDDIATVLNQIAEKEKIKLPKDVNNIITISADGDLKQAIGYLQIISKATDINVDNFYKIFNMPSFVTIKQIINYCMAKDYRAYKLLQGLIDNGYNINDILDIILKVVSDYEFPTEKIRKEYIKAIAKCFYMTETSNSHQHLYYLISTMSNGINCK